MTWTDDRIAELTRLWARGDWAAVIGDALGVSKNAVIGKAHRLKLPARREPRWRIEGNIKVRRVRRKRAVASPRKRLGAGDVPAIAKLRLRSHQLANKAKKKSAPRRGKRMWTDPPPPPEAKMLTLMQLTEKSCRYPFGDPRDAAFGYCGHDKVPGLSWCEAHLFIVYQPVESRKVAA
jgi:GcrA cell cycle regulator